MADKPRILIVDDERAVRAALRDYFEANGYDVDEATGCKGALVAIEEDPPDVAILDYSLDDGHALDLMDELKNVDSEVPIIIMTGHGTIDLAVRAIKEGAEQFFTKPAELPAVRVVIERILENRRNRRQQILGRARSERRALNPFLGISAAIRRLEQTAQRVLVSESPVLIQGETGTGKGVLAEWLHRNGPRANEAFVDLNCAGLSREFLETELFGHERGAFTGAHATKSGLLELADRGTVFLDEIGDMDLQVQAKLLKTIEEKRYRRLGDVKDRKVDVRLIAATHHDLTEQMRQQKFRSDFFFRISTLPLTVPPLRERPEDIPMIAEELLSSLTRAMGRPAMSLTGDALKTLQAYRWPGNVREMRNVLERAVLLGERPELRRRDLYFDLGGVFEGPVGSATLQDVEVRHIERVLREEGGHVARAAVKLGVPRSTLYEKIKKYGIRSAAAAG